ncbi:MAG: DUF1816 domain-containing protein [Oscillatoria sp. PMC 1068.18]|nr:DUF1816 domain-containing protein [Oscillatoria sp. PMC 1076.18]MEC4991219.1 DUF1816 domain-containing protein [Oscillatoria sp. PMC 1068.18]
MKEMLMKILEFFGLACWIEIVTDNPRCTYYFGPFMTKAEAEEATGGYVEDLKNENAQGIAVSIKRCKPKNLTVFDEFAEPREFERIPTLSGQPS